MIGLNQMSLVGNQAAVLGFSPLSLFAAGEQGVWYDPSDFSTMFQDSAGTTPVTAVGQSVGKILDKSGRGNHATQATTANRPVLQVDGNGCYYLSFDGINDLLSTQSVDFSSTNKMSTFTGARKLVDTTGSILVEHSTDVSSHPGSFYVSAPDSTTNKWGVISRGSATLTGGQGSFVTSVGTAPDTAVITGLHDISGNNSTIRRNGVAYPSGTSSQGTGNFGNYPLYIGGRGTLSVYFTGRIYSLIVRGASSTADQIAKTESWVNQKTAAY